jgi:branched-chain amino acid transport system substrate-binding protein
MIFPEYDAVAVRREEAQMRCQPHIRFRFAFAVGAVLIAAPGIGSAAQRSDRIDALLQIATGVGRAMSAASVCREISWPRIKALTDKFSDLVKVSVTQGEVFSTIQQAYDQSAIEGQRTVSSKQTDCVAAVRDLADLERTVTLQADAAASPPTQADPPTQSRSATVVPSPAPVTTGAALPQRHR